VTRISTFLRVAQFVRARETAAARNEPFTIPEVIALLGVSRVTLNRWAAQGRINLRGVNNGKTPVPTVWASEVRRLLDVPEPPAKRQRRNTISSTEKGVPVKGRPSDSHRPVSRGPDRTSLCLMPETAT
jgi:hypothetical protein